MVFNMSYSSEYNFWEHIVLLKNLSYLGRKMMIVHIYKMTGSYTFMSTVLPLGR